MWSTLYQWPYLRLHILRHLNLRWNLTPFYHVWLNFILSWHSLTVEYTRCFLAAWHCKNSPEVKICFSSFPSAHQRSIRMYKRKYSFSHECRLKYKRPGAYRVIGLHICRLRLVPFKEKSRYEILIEMIIKLVTQDFRRAFDWQTFLERLKILTQYTTANMIFTFNVALSDEHRH